MDVAKTWWLSCFLICSGVKGVQVFPSTQCVSNIVRNEETGCLHKRFTKLYKKNETKETEKDKFTHIRHQILQENLKFLQYFVWDNTRLLKRLLLEHWELKEDTFWFSCSCEDENSDTFLKTC